MKKIISIICVWINLISFLLFMPSASYGICNTFNFRKKLSAVQLTLANGAVLHDIRINKSKNQQAQLTENSYKYLNLAFVIETEDDIYSNRKKIEPFIEQIYEYYGIFNEKVKIGIITFDGASVNENIEAYENLDIYKNSKDDILKDIEQLKSDTDLSLEGALRIVTKDLLENNGPESEELLQQVVLITDGIEDQSVIDNSRSVLDTLEENMVSMYEVVIGDWYESSEHKRLIDGVVGLQAVQINEVTDIEYQLTKDLYEYIIEFVINDEDFMPTGTERNTMLMSDKVVLIVDSEIAQGATLKIEYTMPIRTRALYGNSEIQSLEIEDTKSERLSFSEDETLITEPSKKNAYYGWKMTEIRNAQNEPELKLVTTKREAEIKLVLSVLLSAKQLEDAEYSNVAKCHAVIEVDEGNFTNYDKVSQAMKVQIVPPFGTEEEKESITYISVDWLIAGIVLITTVVIIIIKIRKKVN